MTHTARMCTRNAASVPVPARGRIRRTGLNRGEKAVSGGSGALGEGGPQARRLVPGRFGVGALRRADASLRPGSRHRADARLGAGPRHGADAPLGARASAKTPAPGRADAPHIADAPPGAGAPDWASARRTGRFSLGGRSPCAEWREKRLRAAKPTSSPPPRSRMTTIRTRKGMLNGRTTPPVAGAGAAAPTRTLTEAVRRAVRERWDVSATVARGPWPQEARRRHQCPAPAEPLRPAPVAVPVPDSWPVRPGAASTRGRWLSRALALGEVDVQRGTVGLARQRPLGGSRCRSSGRRRVRDHIWF